MATNLTIAANTGLVDDEYGVTGADWTVIDEDNDYLIFTNGSDVVKDGEALPSQTALNSAGIRIGEGVEVIVDTYLLADFDASELKEIGLMGDQDAQHVLAFDFDGATATEPVLEAWDNSSMNTIDLPSLGAGTSSNSWFRGITTTLASSGVAGWIGNKLAGASVGNFLFLNDQSGPLSVAKTLYCQLKMAIPLTITDSNSDQPLLVVKYGSN